MKKCFLIISLLATSAANAQSVFGYWYGSANVKGTSIANNYLVELILQPEKGYVQGILNYYFKDNYRSLKIKGSYNPETRQVAFQNIPVSYFASTSNFEVDCKMNFTAKLKISQLDSTIFGSFTSAPEYKYMCPELNFSLVFRADISKKDSVLQVISQHKEQYQAWQPAVDDTIKAAIVQQRKVVNYVIEKEFEKREQALVNTIDVSSDSVSVDLYDNGEIDGDSISIFYDQKLIAFNMRLSDRSLHFKLAADSVNEISMLAQNLGSIPPNTALMIITDGDIRHQVRLSSDLKKSGTIRLRRKTPGKP